MDNINNSMNDSHLLASSYDDPGSESKNPEPQIVAVSMFGKSYRIRSDQPELVKHLSDLVNEETQMVMVSSSAALNDGDLPIQVSFRLALLLYQCRQELSKLADSVQETENRIVQLTASIDSSLNQD